MQQTTGDLPLRLYHFIQQSQVRGMQIQLWLLQPHTIPRPLKHHRGFRYGLLDQPCPAGSTNITKGALTAIGQVEARHEVSSTTPPTRLPTFLIHAFLLFLLLLSNSKHVLPRPGPSDTASPHANQILDLTVSSFIVP